MHTINHKGSTIFSDDMPARYSLLWRETGNPAPVPACAPSPKASGCLAKVFECSNTELLTVSFIWQSFLRLKVHRHIRERNPFFEVISTCFIHNQYYVPIAQYSDAHFAARINAVFIVNQYVAGSNQ